MTASDDPYVTFIDGPPRLGALHNATIDPSRQHQGSLTAGKHEYDRGPVEWRPDLNTEVAAHQRSMPWPERSKLNVAARDLGRLEPRYTEKLNRSSPRFPTIGEAAQRRRDFWMKIVARGGIAMMVASPVIAVWKGTGIFPAGAFTAGLIIFAGMCFVSGNCRRL